MFLKVSNTSATSINRHIVFPSTQLTMHSLQLTYLDLHPLPIQRSVPSHRAVNSFHVIERRLRRLRLDATARSPDALKSAEDFARLDDRVAIRAISEARRILGEMRKGRVGGVGGLEEVSAVRICVSPQITQIVL